MWTTVENRSKWGSVCFVKKLLRRSSQKRAGWEAVFRPPPVGAQAGLMEVVCPPTDCRRNEVASSPSNRSATARPREFGRKSQRRIGDVKEVCYRAERLRCSVSNEGLTRRLPGGRRGGWNQSPEGGNSAGRIASFRTNSVISAPVVEQRAQQPCQPGCWRRRDCARATHPRPGSQIASRCRTDFGRRHSAPGS
jgi:hypothetical protein